MSCGNWLPCLVATNQIAPFTTGRLTLPARVTVALYLRVNPIHRLVVALVIILRTEALTASR